MCPLSNVPELADQLAASQEDSARKRGNVAGGVTKFSALPYFVRLVDVAPDVRFGDLGIVGKLVLPTF